MFAALDSVLLTHSVIAYFLGPFASKASSSIQMNAEERREIVGTVSALAKTLAAAVRRT